WAIRKSDVISDIGIQTIINNQAKYARLITDDADGFITNIDLRKENQGGLKTSGIDVEANWRGDSSEYGRLSASFSGTYVFE
ncbi:hypothetical protein, partial [Raoultella planticola]